MVINPQSITNFPLKFQAPHFDPYSINLDSFGVCPEVEGLLSQYGHTGYLLGVYRYDLVAVTYGNHNNSGISRFYMPQITSDSIRRRIVSETLQFYHSSIRGCERAAEDVVDTTVAFDIFYNIYAVSSVLKALQYPRFAGQLNVAGPIGKLP